MANLPSSLDTLSERYRTHFTPCPLAEIAEKHRNAVAVEEGIVRGLACKDLPLDPQALRLFPGLRVLNLWHQSLVEAPDFSFLPELEDLTLTACGLGRITKLALLTQLKRLDLSLNYIRHLAPLSHLKALQSLRLGFNYIEDLRPLKALANLRALDIHSHLTIDITPIAELSLESLSLARVTQPDVLGKMTRLTHLNMSRVRDITPLTRLVRLANLSLIGDDLDQIELLAQIPNLAELKLFFSGYTTGAGLADRRPPPTTETMKF